MKQTLKLIVLVSCTLLFAGCTNSEPEKKPLNIAILTLDDMGYGTTGAEGCTVPGITPNIDRLASQGMMFTHGYVMSPICRPSRMALLSGRYPHCNGVMGHGEQPPPGWQEPDVITPSLSKYLTERGYFTGAIFKHGREKGNVWNIQYHEWPNGTGYHDRNPDSFYKRTKSILSRANDLGKPFFLYANPIDPHRPWVDTEEERSSFAMYNPDNPYPEPSMKYVPEDVHVPDFLPDLPEIRENLVPYYESLHRGDECIGVILKALEESGHMNNTLVLFLSDNGMGAPGAKGTLFHHGLRTPIIVRWPGEVEEGIVNDHSIISNIDIFPTLLDAIGAPPIEGIEGRSFIDLLRGREQDKPREYAYAAQNYFIKPVEEDFYPHRAIIDTGFCYIWNSYILQPNGDRKYPNHWLDVVESSLDGSHPGLSEKINNLHYKPVEELYDLSVDPGCWKNLAESPEHKKILDSYRDRLFHEMENTMDPELQVFRDFMKDQEANPEDFRGFEK
jgi:N-sulfoglucosamine sulfohydrolase